jgi:hypothetical protein
MPEGESAGGSETTRRPPGLRNAAAHSAVTGGGAKERATTRSNAPLRSDLAATSARERITLTRLPHPHASTTFCKATVLRRFASRSAAAVRCQ